MSDKVQKILDEIKELSLLEASQLVKSLESCPRSHEPWSQGSQGLGRWGSQDPEGRRQQG